MARCNRIKSNSDAYYHVICRIVSQDFLLKEDKKKRFLIDLLYRAADFSGVDIGGYVIMDNHLHLIVHTGEKQIVPEEEVLRRIEILYGKSRMKRCSVNWERLRKENRSEERETEIDVYRKRMGDLSEFMKTFKQRFSQWYNGVTGHIGTLWTGRFKSILISKRGYLKSLCDYIHMNPVRVGLVSDPAFYMWSSLGAARLGDFRAQRGQALLIASTRAPSYIGESHLGETASSPPLSLQRGQAPRKVTG